LVDDAKQANSFVDAISVEWMNDIISASRKKPVYQQRDGDERATKFWEQQPRMPASPKKTGWEAEEPSMVRHFKTLILLFSNVQRAALCNNHYFSPILQKQVSVEGLSRTMSCSIRAISFIV
jgi:hypothetical protein